MATPTEAQTAHQQLVDQLDLHTVHKSFRSTAWRPSQRRNKTIKTIKTIVGDASRKDGAPSSSTAVLAPANLEGGGAHDGDASRNKSSAGNNAVGSGSEALSASGSSTPGTAPSAFGTSSQKPRLAQASRSLCKLVLGKRLRASGSETISGAATTATVTAKTNAETVAGGGGGSTPSATYTNIESAPSLGHTKRYCDVTGLAAPYIDPKSRLWYHDKEVFVFVRSFPQGVAEHYLKMRGAHAVLR